MKKIIVMFAVLSLAILSACSGGKPQPSDSTETESQTMEQQTAEQQTDSMEKKMILIVDGREIPVIWEENNTVSELKTRIEDEPVVIEMEKYGGFEQVGSLGQSFTSDDERIMTECGDIVLYNSSNIVIFYGSNTWEYTRLGKIDLDDDEIAEMLGGEAVEVQITLK